MSAEHQYGVLLPHFGRHASRQRLIEGAQHVERLGFDSVWVRDHLVFEPHGFEDADNTHVDPFVVLSAIAAATDRITLATGTLIPHRNPVHAALLMGSLDFIAGPGRLLMSWGLGWSQHEFETAGLGHADRRYLLEEQVDIFRRLWTGEPITHRGTYYQLDNVKIRPVPAQPIPIWYGGTSAAAVRRTVEYCDGWIPGRLPLWDFERLMQRMQRLAEQAGKPTPPAGTIPYVVPGRTLEDALRYVDLPPFLAEMQERYSPPPSGEYRTADDLAGALILGPPDRIVEGVRRCEAAGASHVVFDLRLRFADFEECVQLIAEEVLPELRRGAAAQVPSPAAI